jgi:hypothetical protein
MGDIWALSRASSIWWRSVQDLRTEAPSLFYNLQIICSDGELSWNRLCLAMSDSALYELLVKTDRLEEVLIFMPDSKVETLKYRLEEFLPSTIKQSGNNEINIIHDDTEEEEEALDNIENIEISMMEEMIRNDKQSYSLEENNTLQIQDLFGFCCLVCRKSLKNKNVLSDHIEKWHTEGDMKMYGFKDLEEYIKCVSPMSSEQVDLR